MTRWVAVFEDNPDAGWVRQRHGQEHFDYLSAHGGKIRIGGGLRAQPGGSFVGGLWVLEVESREEAARLCEEDPYFRHGLRKGYQLYVWGKAPFYGDVVL